MSRGLQVVTGHAVVLSHGVGIADDGRSAADRTARAFMRSLTHVRVRARRWRR